MRKWWFVHGSLEAILFIVVAASRYAREKYQKETEERFNANSDIECLAATILFWRRQVLELQEQPR